MFVSQIVAVLCTLAVTSATPGLFSFSKSINIGGYSSGPAYSSYSAPAISYAAPARVSTYIVEPQTYHAAPAYHYAAAPAVQYASYAAPAVSYAAVPSRVSTYVVQPQAYTKTFSLGFGKSW